MNIKALITTLVLGSSAIAPSLAMASPSWSGGVKVTTTSDRYRGPEVRDHRGAQPQPVVRDHRDDSDRDRGSYDRDRDEMRPPAVQVAVPVPASDTCSNIVIGGDDSSYIGAMGGWSGGWLQITMPTRIERGREFVTVKTDRRFSQIQLRSDAGVTHITQVAIDLGNGRTQVVRLDTTLDARNPVLSLSLQNRTSVKRVIVYGSSGSFARYSIFAA